MAEAGSITVPVKVVVEGVQDAAEHVPIQATNSEHPTAKRICEVFVENGRYYVYKDPQFALTDEGLGTILTKVGVDLTGNQRGVR